MEQAQTGVTVRGVTQQACAGAFSCLGVDGDGRRRCEWKGVRLEEGSY